jgi:hypothetical protein
MSNFHSKWKQYLQEAQQDAKVLRNINIKAIQKEMPQFPDEEVRNYFARIQGLEQNPEFLNPIFPTGLVSWMESLPDNHFPTNGRKRFAKWLANAVYRQETDVNNNIDSVDNPEELRVYNNDVRYITDYFNGAQDIPQNIWDMTFQQVFDLSEEWHEQFKGNEDNAGPYETKDVVYDFENGFTIVKVPPQDLGTEGERMGHCVGGYCDDVSAGRTIIYSLRDRNNNPHATIEVEKTRYESAVQQIKGKGNATPVKKYRPMIKQWLKTTNFNYHDSYDYQNILDVEDYRTDLEGDKFFKNTAMALTAARSVDPEVVRYMLGRFEEIVAEKGGNEYLDEMRTWGEEEDQRHLNDVIDNLSQNGYLELPEIVRIAKVGYRAGIGSQIESMLSAGSQQKYSEHYGKETNHIIARAVYKEMKDELFDTTPREWDDNERNSLLKQQVFFLSAIARQDPKARQEIVDFLLSPEMVQRQAATSRPTNNVYTTTFRHYLHTSGNEYRRITKAQNHFLHDVIIANPATVKRIFDFQASEEGRKILPQTAPDQLLVSMADLPKLPQEVLDYFVEYTSKTAGVNNSKITDKVIESPGVDIEIKKKLIYNSYMKDEQHLPMEGYRYSGYAKIFARKLYDAFPKIDSELSQWILDNGLLDAFFVGRWTSTQLKNTGWSPRLTALDSEEERDLKSSIKMQKKKFQRLIQIRARKEKEQLQEQIQKYFGKNIMTKSNFYDTIKEQLGINEEKGRSRQRGIYKFYCMISYGLTTEGDKARGLDDILADMRALPNVTIVTVAVRNQKIAEGRYIAGLAIKFIPSTPGDMNTPENVKARIVRDIKRLANVQSLFKLSTGLIRLE